jgi:hypothetical protein
MIFIAAACQSYFLGNNILGQSTDIYLVVVSKQQNYVVMIRSLNVLKKKFRYTMIGIDK